MMASIIFVIFLLAPVLGQGTFINEIHKQYLKQGIPFRENYFLDNMPILAEYDFIVVGSGPAGCAIANRLSEVSQWKVLLLEKGNEGNVYSEIPVINPFLLVGKLVEIQDLEKEENVCTGLVGNRCHWPSGNGVGGASLVNGMIYTRGSSADYDSWGIQGWSYADVLPYFMKSENMSIDSLEKSPYHSTGGPLNIQYPFSSKMGELFLRAGKELGYEIIDYNNPESAVGFSPTQITTKRGRRLSAASAFLVPVKYRNNLHIVKNALVTEILITPTTNTAYGVKFLIKNKERVAMARKEVIICAGAFGSPKLLMLSGIGPASDLHYLNIPVLANLPVGKNLQEHLGTPSVVLTINSTDSYTMPKMLGSVSRDLFQWLNGINNLYMNNGAEALAYSTSGVSDGRPDIELILTPTALPADAGFLIKRTLFMKDEVYTRTYGNYKYAESFTIAPMVMYPRSRGQAKLMSRNPSDPLIVNGNFFGDPHDMRVMIDGVRAALMVANTNAFQQIGARLFPVPLSGCEMYIFNSDEYWECAIRAVPVQYHHQCGTCAMGSNPDNSVVDPRLRVHGVSRLRVADASIIPVMPGVHTMAACYMIGEKAADMIKEDWGIFE